jgi:hypothetical protein
MANIIYSTQQQLFHRQAPPQCSDLTNHQPNCKCVICQYPWHIIDGFTHLGKKEHPPKFQFAHLFTHITYDKSLFKGKTPCLDGIPNNILKALPTSFHEMLFLFFQQCYQQKSIPKEWKHCTIILHKKGTLTNIRNYGAIALVGTTYKLFTSTLASLLTTFNEHQ